jgi:hypothetical protein
MPTGCPPCSPCFQCGCAPDRPDHQYRLEEQPDKPRAIRIQAKGVCSRDELGDVSRKDHYEEPSDDPAHYWSVALRREYEGSAQDKFDNSGDGYDGFGRRHPRGNLSQERFSIREVSDSSADEEYPQGETPNGSQREVSS